MRATGRYRGQATADRAVSFGFSRDRICVFPWGVDLTKFSPQSSIVPGKAWRQQQGWNDAIVLLCLRAWEPNYQIATLIDAFALLRQQLSGAPLHLHLLGGGLLEQALRAPEPGQRAST